MLFARKIMLTALLAGLVSACAPAPAQGPTSEPTPESEVTQTPKNPQPTPPPLPPPTGDATSFQRQFVEVVKHVQQGVVAITAVSEAEVEPSPHSFEGSPFDFFRRGLPQPDSAPETQRRQGIGSGLIVEGGFILTNNHVVADADEITVVLQDDRTLQAELVGADPKTDLAVIKVKKTDTLPGPMALGDSGKLEVGEWVMAMGAPFGLKQTVSAGIVSAVGRGNMGIADYEDFIQTDAAINPGNSGGPLVDLQGRVIGINTAIASRSGGNQGIGFAIPINMARKVMRQLIDKGKVVRGQLGVFITDLTPDLAHAFGYEGKGILVQDLVADSPAQGILKPGDIITAWDGKAVHKVVPFRNGIASSPPGTTVRLTIVRNGDRQEVSVTLGELASAGANHSTVDPDEDARWGFTLDDLSPALQRQLNVPPGTRGAVVLRVVPGSPAERSGLQSRDVIIQVQGSAVDSAAATTQAMLSAPSDRPVRLRVLREGRGLFIALAPRE